MDDNKPLTEYGLNGKFAKAQAPATMRLVFQDLGSEKFETLEVTLLFGPREIPDVMKATVSQAYVRTLTWTWQ